MALTINGSSPKAINWNGSEVKKVTCNGATLWEAESLITLNGSVCFYRGASYPNSINRASAAIGPTSSANQGAIVWFDFTGYDAANIDASKDASLVLHFTSGNYLADVLKILPTAGLVPYLSTSTENSTSFSSFKAKENAAHGGTVSGSDITIPISGSDLVTYRGSTVTPTGSGKAIMSFGVRCNWNNPVLYDTDNPPTLSFYYKN